MECIEISTYTRAATGSSNSYTLDGAHLEHVPLRLTAGRCHHAVDLVLPCEELEALLQEDQGLTLK